MTRTSRIASLSLAACLGLAACDSDPVGSSGTPEGSLSFSYQGAFNGSYSATGGLNPDDNGTLEWDDFAIGVSYFDEAEGEPFVDLFSIDPTSATRGHLVDLFIPQVLAPTTLSLDMAACVDDAAQQTLRAGCAQGFFVFDTNIDLDEGEVWVTKSGSVRIEEVSNRRMSGIFSATLVSKEGRTVTITNGTFDVPVVSQETLARANRSPAPARISSPAARRVLAARS